MLLYSFSSSLISFLISLTSHLSHLLDGCLLFYLITVVHLSIYSFLQLQLLYGSNLFCIFKGQQSNIINFSLSLSICVCDLIFLYILAVNLYKNKN